MYLGKILKSVDKKYKYIKSSGICFDSRKIKRGNIFFAIRGRNKSGKNFLNTVIKKKACCVVIDENIKKKNYKIPIITVKDCRKSLAEASSNVYKQKPKNIIAVTGTNGKSSVANFFYQILSLNNILSASIGTLGINTKKFKKTTNLTSVDSLSLHKSLFNLVKNKINNVIIEASSHGLHQNRLDYLNFKTAIFTNLSHDHLDYHKNMKKYLKSKMYLFNTLLKKNSNIITDLNNKEFIKIKKIAHLKKLKLKSIGYNGADLKILNHSYNGAHQVLKIFYKSKIYNFKVPLIGFIQCKNLLMAILAANSIGLKMDKIIKVINKLKPTEGRLECIKVLKNNSKIILDFAHTSAALEQVLKTIKQHFGKDVSIIFGCGGDRDTYKRSKMGKIAKKYCKKIYITDDNPRTENPSKIRKAIIGNNKKHFIEIPSRKKAIETAIVNLHGDEILLIAGKGHEKFQDYGNYKIKFSDKKIVDKITQSKNSLFRNYNWKFNILKSSLKNKNINNFNFNEISINSAQIKKNDLFIAIKGKKKDGHNYVRAALKKGAIKSIVTKKIKNVSINKQIKVKNSLKALNEIGRITRDFSNSTIIGITGSSGKTSLKNFLSYSLKVFGNVYSSPKSFNNQYGVPLSLSNLKQDTKYGIFEIGMSKKNEINKLSKIVKPHVAIITNIAEAHIKNFKNINEIAKAKSEIINNICKDGNIILNRDDSFFQYFSKLAKIKKLNIITFSLKLKSNVYLKKIIKKRKNYKATININNKNYFFYIKYNFESYVKNLLATLVVLNLLNLNFNKLKFHFLKFDLPEGRGDLSTINIYKKKITFIDESYNANPLSMKLAIKNLHNYQQRKGKKIIFLGDMLELGKYSKKNHQLLSKLINKTNIDRVFVCGKYIKETFKYLLNKKKGKIIKSPNSIFDILKKDVRNNDTIMIKGSNATGFYLLSQNLKKGISNAL